MKLVKKILNRFNGLHYTQEYLCLAEETFQKPLHMYLAENEKAVCEVDNSHVFVGYCPLVFVFLSSVISAVQKQIIDIVFSQESLSISIPFEKNEIVARLRLKEIAQQHAGNETLYYYEAIHGQHRFISRFHQYNIQLYNKLYNRKPGNVFLENNLYKQVQIAYSLPRKISLITVGQNDLYNHFPTDLHGQVSDDFYVISLRHQGNACKQVLDAKRIVLSDMQASAYKQAYGLGKNHMQALKERTAFDFSDQLSECFAFPLPKNIVEYKELELQDSFIHGIHRFLLFKIVTIKTLTDHPQALMHIHNVYATWRYKKGLTANYFLK